MENAFEANPPKDLGTVVVITSDSIYRHSVAQIDISSELPFQVALTGQIIQVETGRQTRNNFIESILTGDLYGISVKAMDWFVEQKVDEREPDGTSNFYGMRFFPFVSSFVTGKIAISGTYIRSVILDLPDSFRVMWEGQQVCDSKGNRAKLDHAYSPLRSQYVFRWPGRKIVAEEGEYPVYIPVRYSGTFLFKVAEYPLYYGVISLMAIALAAMAENIGIMFGAVVAVYGFMLRSLLVAGMPQRSTILTHSYIIAAAGMTLWGILFHFWGICSLVAALPIVYAVYRVQQTIRYFSDTGVLPQTVAYYWSKRIMKREIAQIKAMKERQARHGN